MAFLQRLPVRPSLKVHSSSIFHPISLTCQKFGHKFKRFASSRTNDTQDVVVIGGGPGGYVAAIKAAQLGKNVTCVEKRGKLGGTCLNVGCIPSKALLHSSHLFHEAVAEFRKHGITAKDVSVDISSMMKQKENGVNHLTKGIEMLFKKNKINYVVGNANILSPKSVFVALNKGGRKIIDCKNIIIASGSTPVSLPNIKVDEKHIVSSTGALEFQGVPKKLTVIGAGVIGLELGSVWKRLGSDVTFIEYAKSIGGVLDKDISRAYKRILEKQKMKFLMGTKVTAAESTDMGVEIRTESAAGGSEKKMMSDALLVAVGRMPFTHGLGLKGVGIHVDRRGRIPIDDQFRTDIPNIYAIGDVVRGPMLAHKAEDEGIAVANIIAGKKGHVNYDAIPGVIYTSPEVATVGLTEDQCREKKIRYSVGKFPFAANSRSLAIGDGVGMVKAISEKKSRKLLGVHILGSNASEMISEAVLALEQELSAQDVAQSCHAHPTFSEAVKEACMASYDKPINM